MGLLGRPCREHRHSESMRLMLSADTHKPQFRKKISSKWHSPKARVFCRSRRYSYRGYASSIAGAPSPFQSDFIKQLLFFETEQHIVFSVRTWAHSPLSANSRAYLQLRNFCRDTCIFCTPFFEVHDTAPKISFLDTPDFIAYTGRQRYKCCR